MKEFIKNNSKPLIYTIGIMITAITITLINHSYAAGENNSIYTRDELSELIEHEQYKGAFASIGGSITSDAVNVFTPLSIELGRNTNEEVFSFANNELIVHKSGAYLFLLKSQFNFSTRTNDIGCGYFSINGEGGLTTLSRGSTNLSLGEWTYDHASQIYRLNPGDRIGLMYVTRSNARIVINGNVTYLG